ncbi:MAG: hypothetical protein JST76_09255, partial [Bacteroidetes bacterium]|nr:hypothetical protein [Bacteroidota bacterium]
VLHYFDKRESIFKELDEAAHRYFTKEEIDEFFVPERTDYDVLVKLRRFKVVRQDFLQQILHSAPFDGYTMWEAGGYDGVIADPYRDPTKVPTRFDNSRYFVRPAKLSELSKSEEEHLLALLEGRLSELHITHWREGDKIAIDRYYPGRIQSP